MTQDKSTMPSDLADFEAARPTSRLVGVVVVAVLVVAALGYAFTGMPDYAALAAQAVAAQRVKAHASDGQPDAAQLAAMADKLAERLKAQSDDAPGWAMLGRVRMVQDRADEAVAAYQRALALRGDDARLLADYAETLGMKNGRTLVGEPSKLLARALAIEPLNGKALALSGAAAFQRADYAGAVAHWEKLLAASPPEAEFVAQLRTSINEARQLGKLPAAVAAVAVAASPSAASTAASTAAARSASVSGTVTLAAALAARAEPDDTVFIVARAAVGPRMPLAVLRKQVKDLPISFTLDDSLAMAPAMKLSNFSKVVVIARVSKSGQAIAAPGDLTGQTTVVDVGASALRVEVNEVVAKP